MNTLAFTFFNLLFCYNSEQPIERNLNYDFHEIHTQIVNFNPSKIPAKNNGFEFSINAGWNHPFGVSLGISQTLNKTHRIGIGFGNSLNGFKYGFLYSFNLITDGNFRPFLGFGFGIASGQGSLFKEKNRYGDPKPIQTGITLNPRIGIRFSDDFSPFDLCFGYCFSPELKGSFYSKSKDKSYPLGGIELSVSKIFKL